VDVKSIDAAMSLLDKVLWDMQHSSRGVADMAHSGFAETGATIGGQGGVAGTVAWGGREPLLAPFATMDFAAY